MPHDDQQTNTALPEVRLPEPDLFVSPDTRRKAPMRVAMIVGGIVLIVAGVGLGILPIVPGFPLTIAGVLMLAASSSLARRALNAIERVLPHRVRTTLRRLLRRPPPQRHRTQP
jgi:UPF0716 family protein affecting phage T7 exclusion